MNKATIASLVRHALTFAGGYLAAKGIALDDESIQAIAGGVAAVVGLAWSFVDKRKANPPASQD